MPNTITGLIPIIYRALDIVVRELTGMISSVTWFPGADAVALNQTIRYPVVPAYSAGDITPAATGPNPGDSTISYGDMTINKSRAVSFYWTGPDQISLGSMYEKILVDQFAQAMRTLVNEIEGDLCGLYTHASRNAGTAGTTPFGSTLSDLAQVLKILLDNGAPTTDLQCVINTAAGANLRSLANLTKVSEAGTSDVLRRGVLIDIFGFMVRESAQIKSHTKGTGANYVLNGAHSAGATTINVKTGTGTILAGDVISIGTDTDRYTVVTALSGGSLTIARPGLLKSYTDSTAVSLSNNRVANLAFSKSAIHLVTRVPEMPSGGDAASDVTVVTDEATGLSFQIALYRQYRRVAYEVGINWGVKAVKQEAIAGLMG